jgi:hypothetical protein
MKNVFDEEGLCCVVWLMRVNEYDMMINNNEIDVVGNS